MDPEEVMTALMAVLFLLYCMSTVCETCCANQRLM